MVELIEVVMGNGPLDRAGSSWSRPEAVELGGVDSASWTRRTSLRFDTRGGSHDGASYPLPAERAVVGREQPLPPRHQYAVGEATLPPEPVALVPDESWERYVLREDEHGWVFEYAGQPGSDAAPSAA